MTQPDHTHCWHDTGVALAMHPPIHIDRCCHCGEVRRRQDTQPSAAGHGPYLPGYYRHTTVHTYPQHRGLAATDPANLNTHNHDGTPKVTCHINTTLTTAPSRAQSAHRRVMDKYDETFKKLADS